MLKLLGKIYELFTKNVWTRIAGAMVSSFLGYIANTWLKMLMKPVWDVAIFALTPAA